IILRMLFMQWWWSGQRLPVCHLRLYFSEVKFAVIAKHPDLTPFTPDALFSAYLSVAIQPKLLVSPVAVTNFCQMRQYIVLIATFQQVIHPPTVWCQRLP